MIDRKKINEIKRTIFKKFPDYKGIKPTITEKSVRPQHALFKKLSLGSPKRPYRIVRLRFKKKVTAEDEVILHKVLTVTLNEQGRILKITESR